MTPSENKNHSEVDIGIQVPGRSCPPHECCLPVAGVVDDAELASQASNTGSATLSVQQRNRRKQKSMSAVGYRHQRACRKEKKTLEDVAYATYVK